MTQVRSSSRFVIISLVCLLLIPTLALAKPASPEPIGRLSASASAAQWAISGNHEKVTLTVVGPDGAIFRKDFVGGTMPMLTPRDLGAKLVDGSYQYELRATPHISAAVRNQLAAARRDDADNESVIRIQKNAGISEPIVQSGSLMVVNGAFVPSDLEEPSVMRLKESNNGGSGTTSAAAISNPKVKPMDVVTPDDVIIQGSACIGLDCVNNESFGFDTIRLKENNTRIKFEDTSVGTFPTNDWQLTANDSASGASSKFSIEDITGSRVPFTITAGASTNSIFVDSTGRVGFRTSTPVLDLHVNTSNTPALRLEQNNSGGFTAQTWDVAGNEANFFVRDVTGGSRLPFRIRPGAPTSSVDISSDGDVGVGTASPSNKLHVFTSVSSDGLSIDGTTFPAIVLRISGAIKGFAPAVVTSNGGFFTNASTGDFAFRSEANKILFGVGSANATMAISGNNVGIGTASPGSQLVIASGATTSSINAGSAQFTVASSRTFKENIEPTDVPDILQKIEAVPVVTYDFKDNGAKNRLGLIAEDFHTVLGRGDDKHIDGQDVQMALWMAVQKLTAENKALTDRLTKLEAAQQKAQN